VAPRAGMGLHGVLYGASPTGSEDPRMDVTPTALPDVLVLTSPIHTDARGWLVECFSAAEMRACGLPDRFVQENCSTSHTGVLRGLHFQEGPAQGKLLQVVQGSIYDVVVDLRADSPTLGRWAGLRLAASQPARLWVPPGMAHGFYVTEGPAVVMYQLTAPYAPQWDHCLAWDDPTVGVRWPLQGSPLLSERDRQGLAWSQVPKWRRPPALPGAGA